MADVSPAHEGAVAGPYMPGRLSHQFPNTKGTSVAITDQTTSYTAQVQALREQLVTRVPAELLATFDADAERLSTIDFQSRVVQPGRTAPTFSLENQRGTIISLDSLLAEGPVVLAFYRGEWCPYCNLQLRAYQSVLREIRAKGARLVAVSPQSPDHSLSIAEKNELAFDVLSDPGNSVARTYGLVFSIPASMRDAYLNVGNDLSTFNGESSWELPAPGTFVIARDGTIAFARVDGDYRKRTEPAEIIEALSRLG